MTQSGPHPRTELREGRKALPVAAVDYQPVANLENRARFDRLLDFLRRIAGTPFREEIQKVTDQAGDSQKNLPQ
jgi:hypothetical protein